jgi:hypothetical protein
MEIVNQDEIQHSLPVGFADFTHSNGVNYPGGDACGTDVSRRVTAKAIRAC